MTRNSERKSKSTRKLPTRSSRNISPRCKSNRKRARASSPTDKQNEEICSICYDAIIDIRLKPCNHEILCHICANKLRRPQRCPICRANIHRKISIRNATDDSSASASSAASAASVVSAGIGAVIRKLQNIVFRNPFIPPLQLRGTLGNMSEDRKQKRLEWERLARIERQRRVFDSVNAIGAANNISAAGVSPADTVNISAINRRSLQNFVRQDPFIPPIELRGDIENMFGEKKQKRREWERLARAERQRLQTPPNTGRRDSASDDIN